MTPDATNRNENPYGSAIKNKLNVNLTTFNFTHETQDYL